MKVNRLADAVENKLRPQAEKEHHKAVQNTLNIVAWRKAKSTPVRNVLGRAVCARRGHRYPAAAENPEVLQFCTRCGMEIAGREPLFI